MSRAAGFEVATPASWFDLDLDSSTRRASIARMVEHSADHLDVPRRDELARLLEHGAAEAQAQNAVFAAIYSEVIQERPVSASLVVSVQSGKSTRPGTVNRSDLAQGLSRILAERGSVAVHDLPAGPAVRLRKRTQAPVPGQEVHVEVEHVQWFVPFPDGRQLALLAFSTPTLGLAEPFGDLFDAIAGTLRWT